MSQKIFKTYKVGLIYGRPKWAGYVVRDRNPTPSYRIRLIEIDRSHPILSLIPSFSLPDVLCDPTDLIWSKGTSFEAMTGRTAPSSDGLLAEVFWGFPRL